MQTRVFKALSSQVRLDMLNFLSAEGEVCICELAELSKRDISTASRHVAELERAGLAKTRREGKRIYVSLKNKAALQKLLERANSIGGQK